MLRKICPCDIDGVCPYHAEMVSTCEYWCGDTYSQDEMEDWDEPDSLDLDLGFDPYVGCYTDDC